MFIFKSTRKPCTLSNQRNIPAIFVKQLTRCPWPWRDISRWNMDFTTRMKNSILVNIVAGDMLRALCWGNTCCLMVLMETKLKIKTKLGLLWNKSYLKHSSTFKQKIELKLNKLSTWLDNTDVVPVNNITLVSYHNHYNHIHLITTLMLSPSTPPDSLPDSPISLRIDFAREPALPGLREWLISIYHHITFLENVFISKKYPQNRKSKPGCGTWKNRKCTNAFFSWGWAIKC